MSEPRVASPTTTSLLRHINARRCLRLLRRSAGLSRADIARELGLTRATIGYATRELLDAGLVVEVAEPPGETRIGRPGVRVSLNPGGAYFIGLDVSTSSLTAVLLDLQMQVVARRVEPIGPDPSDVASIVERLVDLPASLTRAGRIDPRRLQGICISIPGLVTRDGRVVNAPFLRWWDVPLLDVMRQRIPGEWPLAVCNDAVALASAECAVSSDRDTENLLLVLMSEGIGSAMVQHGRVVTGAHGYAGEIGKMVMGRTVEDAATGTFEQLAGYRRFLPLLPPGLPIEDGLAALAEETDPDRRRARDDALEGWIVNLATGLVNLIHVHDPERIALGGLLTVLYPLVADRVERLVAASLLAGFDCPTIAVTRFGPDGAAIGAAATVREAIFSLPELDPAPVRIA